MSDGCKQPQSALRLQHFNFCYSTGTSLDIEYEKPFELGFYMNSGSQRASDMFKPFIFGKDGLDNLVAQRLKPEYGSGFRFILVEFYVEGGVDDPNNFPKRKVSRYAAKQFAIRAQIPVLRGHIDALSQSEKAAFAADALEFSVSSVESRLASRITTFDFAALVSDTKELLTEFRRVWKCAI